jgi:hypothetical protein
VKAACLVLAYDSEQFERSLSIPNNWCLHFVEGLQVGAMSVQ